MARSWQWQESAACRGMAVEIFVGPHREPPSRRRDREAAAVRVCAGCPVREACLAHSLEQPEAYGVWGGVTESERAAARRGGRGTAA